MDTPAEPFGRFWPRLHPDVPPLGFAMRRSASENWLRFHSLPESKRYPEGEAEMAEVVARANTLARAVLGDGQPVWLVQAIPSEQGEAPDPAWLTAEARGFTPVMTSPDPDEDEETDWHFYVGPAVWETGAFNRLLAEIALDRAPRTLWSSIETGAVFAPYDGGVDLFLPTPDEVKAVRRSHPTWLSAHPGGL